MTGTYGTLAMPDFATADGTRCASATITFTATEAIEDWQVDLESFTPNSTAGPIVLLTEAAPSQTVTFCTDHDQLGTYSYRGHLHSHLIGENSYPIESYEGAVTFRITTKSPSALTVAVVRSHARSRCPYGKVAHCSKVTGKLVSVGRPIPWSWVQIQAYRGNKWVRQAWGRTDGLGRVVWYVTVTTRQRNWKFRLRFSGNDLSKVSVSRSFRVYY